MTQAVGRRQPKYLKKPTTSPAVQTEFSVFEASNPGLSRDIDTVAIVVGLEFQVTEGAFSGYRLYTDEPQNVQAVLYEIVDATTGNQVEGTLVSSGYAVGTGGVAGWYEYRIATPVVLDPAKKYRAAIWLPSSHYWANSDYFTSGAGGSGLTSGPITVPNRASATGNDQGAFDYSGSLVFPVSEFNGANYGVDVLVRTDYVPEVLLLPKAESGFESGLAWLTGTKQTNAVTTAWASSGTHSLAVTKNATGTDMDVESPTFIPVLSGETITATVTVRAATVGRSVTASLIWYDNAFGLQAQTDHVGADSTSADTDISVSGSPPPGARYVRVDVFFQAGTNNGEVHYLDNVRLVSNIVAPTVATKFPLASSGGSDLSLTTWGSVWTHVGSRVKVPLKTQKSGGVKEFASASVAATNGVPSNVMCYQGVSDRLAAQTISGNWSMIGAFYESASNANASAQMVIRVVSNDGATERGVVYAGHSTAINDTDGALGQEFPTGGYDASRMMQVTGSSVTAQAGDRLVIEIGYRVVPLASATYAGEIDLGDSGHDWRWLVNDEGVRDWDPWVGTTQTIAFLDPAGAELYPANTQTQESSLQAGSNGNTTVTWSTEQAHGGTHSVKAVLDADGFGSVYIDLVEPLAAATYYCSSGWVYSNATVMITAGIVWYNASDGVISSSGGQSVLLRAGEWTKVSGTYLLSPALTAKGITTFNIDGAAALAGVAVYFDDFSLKPLVSSQSLSRTGTDSAPATDVATRVAVHPRAVSDTTSLSDVATRVTVYPRATGDSAPSSDVVTRVKINNRVTGDSSPATDAPTKKLVYARAVPDSAPSSDVLTRVAARARMTADSLTTSDAPTRSQVLARATPDSAPSSDVVTRVTVYPRATSDITSLSDVVTRVKINNRASSDSAPGSDSGAGGAEDLVATSTIFNDWDLVGAATAHAAMAVVAGGEYLNAVDQDLAFEVKFPAPSGAPSAAAVMLSYDTSSGQISISLVEGTTVRATRTAAGIALSATNVMTLTGPELASVTAWNDIRLRITCTTYSLDDPIVYGGYLALTTTGSSGATRVVNRFRAIPDSAPATDVPAKKLAYARAVPASAPATDLVTRSQVLVRLVGDNAPSSDVLAWARAYSRASADSAPSSATVARSQVLARLVADSISVSDAATRQANRSRTSADSITTSDAVARAQVLARLVGDSLSISDAATRQSLKVRGTGDSITTSDAVIRSQVLARVVGDSAPSSAVVTRSQVLARLVADVTSVGDAPTKQFKPNRTPTEVLTTTDAVTRSQVLARVVPEVTSLSDAVARTLIRARATADTAPVTDLATRQASRARTVADSIPLSDLATRQATRSRSASDSVAGLHDDPVYSTARWYYLDGTETLTTSDLVTRAQVLARLTADSAPANAVLTRSVVMARVLNDSASATDVVARVITHPRSTSDSAPATDVVTRMAAHPRAVAETLTTSDTVARTLQRVRSTTDSVAGLLDVVTRVRVLSRLLADSAPAADALTDTQRYFRIPADSAPASDEVARMAARSRAVAEGLTTSDAVARFQAALRSASDLTFVSDALTRSLLLYRQIDDPTDLVDSVERIRVFLRDSFDVVPPVTDIAETGLQYDGYAFDSAPASDAADRVKTVIRSTTDSVAGLAEDLVYWVVPLGIIGPPEVVLLTSDRVRLSIQPGHDRVVLDFTFDQSVTTWTVRANSTSPFDGDTLASWSDRQPATVGQAHVDARLLHRGVNEVRVYGRAAKDGTWTRA